jgi:CubicO group peptidase (beta-lactamase class C family)
MHPLRCLLARLRSPCAVMAAATALAAAHAAPAAAADTTATGGSACDEAWTYSAAHAGIALHVLHDGRLLCERYADGMSRDTAHPLYSGTKGFTGMMAAALAHDGLLDLDERAADTLTEWRGDAQRGGITIRHLLSLSSGLATSGPRAAPGFMEAVGTPAAHAPGTHFAYGPIVFQAFGEIVRRKLAAAGRPEAPTDYLQRRVLAPLGIEVAAWGGPTAGPDPNLAAGASMSAAGWAAFGELVRLPEVAQRVQLHPDAYAAQFTPQGAYRGYGLTWWLATPLPAPTADLDPVARSVDLPQAAHAGLVPADLVVAAGAGGQRLYVSRSRGLTAVRFARFDLAALAAARNASAEARARQAVASERFSDGELVRRLLAALPPAPH